MNPLQIRLSQLGLTLLLVTGICCLVLGLWIIPRDLASLYRLFSRDDGWIFVIPIGLVVVDVFLTLIGLSKGHWELNPYVASAVQIGPWAMIPFVASYIALSEGLGLLMLSLGKWLFTSSSPSTFIPFALISGAASFGPLNNLALLTLDGASSLAYVFGITGIAGLSLGIYLHFAKQQFLRNRLFFRPAA